MFEGMNRENAKYITFVRQRQRIDISSYFFILQQSHENNPIDNFMYGVHVYERKGKNRACG
jgi:hypothetical protein